MREQKYTIPSTAFEQVLDSLGTSLSVRRHTESGRLITYWDTFDGRLWRQGWTLAATHPKPWLEAEDLEAPLILRLRDREGRLRARVHTAERPGLGRHLPGGRLGDLAAPVIDMRRLLPRVHLKVEQQILEVLDDRAKTVVRIVAETGTARAPDGGAPASLEPRLYVRGIQGYEDAHRRAVHAVEELDGVEPTAEDRLEQALCVLGTRPDTYSSKLDFDLDPEMRADEATRFILRRLLDTIRANEEGTKADLDSEFLHDFRVAVRRTRSALAQVKKVFPQEIVDRFKEDFRWLGRITGPTRDLDVYLLKLDGYRKSLPESVRADLDPLEAHLVRRQREEQRRLARQLESPTYAKLLADWQVFLDREPPDDPEPAHAARPVRPVASERIWRVYRRVRKKGRAIGPDSPGEALHRLRIDCKKLRYLLEFFRSLYPEDEIAPLVKTLKKLQDVLGDFNDLTVQQESLDDFAREMTETGNAPAATLLAMGRLQQVFESHKLDERREFHRRFRRLARKKTRARVRELFQEEDS